MADWEEITVGDGWEEIDTPKPKSKPTKRKKPALPKGRQNLMKFLQDKYGDDTTVEVGRTRAGSKTFNYDQTELLQRYYRDQLGFSPEGSWNPFVHAGKYLADLKYGAKQLVGATTPDEDYKFLQSQMIYGGADQPLAAQAAGFGLNMLPGLAGTPIAGVAAGKIAQRGLSNKAIGDYMTRAAHNVASTRGNLPSVPLNTTLGAVEGGLLPVNPESSGASQARQRLDQAALGGITSGALTALGGKASDYLMSRNLQRDIKTAYPDLPVTPRVTLDKITGNPTLERFRENQRVSNTGEDTLVSRRMQQVTDTARRDLAENLDAIEREATGTQVPIAIGEYGEQIVDRFLKEYNKSKGTMNKLYNNVQGLNKVKIVPSEYREFFGRVNNALRKKFITTDADKSRFTYKETGPLKSVIERMENLLDEANNKGNFAVIDANKLFNIEKELNLQLDKIFSSDKNKHLRSVGMSIKKELENYTNNARFLLRGPRGRYMRATRENSPALRDYQAAKEYAATHYSRFTGNDFLDDLLKYVDDTEWKKGNKVNPGSDLMNNIFQGASTKLTSENAPRANAILKLREAIGDSTFTDPHTGGGAVKLNEALRKEAFAAMRKRPDDANVKDFVTSIDSFITPGGRSAIYDPKGDVQLFNDRTFNQLGQLADATRRQFTPVDALGSEIFNYNALPLPRDPFLRNVQEKLFGPSTMGVGDAVRSAYQGLPLLGDLSKGLTAADVSRRIHRGVPGKYGPVGGVTPAYGTYESLFSNIPVEEELDDVVLF